MLRRPATAAALVAVLTAGLALGACAEGDGSLKSRADYVKQTIAAQTTQLGEKARGHTKDIAAYANCMYDVIEANRPELEKVKDSASAVQKILAAHDDECQQALQEAINP